MQLIKLDAIDSTNDYLKVLSAEKTMENFTVVTAENQTKGKGQRGAKWVSEPGKNLVMSVLYKTEANNSKGLYDLNIAVALSVLTALESYQLAALSVKWPNDIMAGAKKIGGILIENSFKPGGEVISVIGIGLNVNQTDFSDLPKASSLAAITGTEFDKAELLLGIVNQLRQNTGILAEGQEAVLWTQYRAKLFRKGVPMAFREPNGADFMGIIQDVTRDGKLEVMLEDDSLRHYAIKEIELLY